jgi:putative membrane protein
MLPTFMQGLPAFVAYFSLGAALLLGFAWVYQRLTAHDETALIRAGNPAAALSFGAVLVGLALPIGAAIENTQSLPAAGFWSLVGCAVQLGAYALARAFVPNLSARIEANDSAAAITLAAVSIAAGLLNAACMSY